MVVDRLIQRLSAGHGAAGAEVPKAEMEKLTEHVSKLAARVEELEAKLAAKN